MTLQFLKQWCLFFLLLAATYNPTGWSFLTWVQNDKDLPASVFFMCGSLFVAGYVYVISKARAGLGERQIAALFLFLWLVLWVLKDMGIAQVATEAALVWFVILFSSLTLAFAKNWPDLRKRRHLRGGRGDQDNKADWLDEDF